MGDFSSRKLAAIMFTDIEGYTALMQESESKALVVREKHRKVFDELTAKFGGKLINYFGDGTLSIFDSAVDAVNCGYELQQQFLADPKIPVRIGIHMGDIVVTEDDIIGNSVNIASRVESLAVVGSVLFSDKVRAEIGNQDNIKFKNVGTYHLKNDDKPRQIFALDMPDLVVPEPDSLSGKTKEKSDSESSADNQENGSIWKKKRLWLGLISILIIGFLGKNFITQQKGKKWAREEAIPQIENLKDQSNFHDAYMLALEAEKYLKKDSGLENLWSKISVQPDIHSNPIGALVYRKVYDAPEDQWEMIGTTPLENVRTYQGPSLYKFVLDGYEESIRFGSPDDLSGPENSILLDKKNILPQGMVRIDDTSSDLDPVVGVDHNNVVEPINSFLIDKYETSNEAFQSFVDAGGYDDPKYWKVPFINNGETLTFQEAMNLFIDKTGRHGPPNWELGEFPKGKGKFPVQGVSWYEAAAYAVFVGKSLPTLFHWDASASTWLSDLVVPQSNIQKNEIAPIGEFQGITSSGLYDVVGNVREWIWNGVDWNENRYIIGGSWNNATHTFNEAGSIDPFDRSDTNGFRCIQYLETNENQEILAKSIDKRQVSFEVGDPVPDDRYELYKRQFDFDKKPFSAISQKIPLAATDRTCEKIEFDAPYGGERMSGYLYLPTNAEPPYQTIIYFPGTDAIWTPVFDPEKAGNLEFVDFVLKSGRAIFYPTIKSTYDRNDGLRNSNPSSSTSYKEHAIMWVKDIIRSVDYLATRPEIDSDKLVYYGLSWGARLGALNLAVEPRFKTGVIVSGGIAILTPLEEVAEYTYLPRVKMPVLMLNGEHDICCFPLEAAQKPFFNLLGTPPEHKKHVIFKNTAHIPARADLIRETLEWLDKYLGKVELNINEVASNLDREM